MKKYYKIILSVVVLLVVAGGSFYGGTIYQKNQAASAKLSFAGNFTGRTSRTGGAGAGFVSGSIISSDANSITISSVTGGSKIVFYSGTTQINKMASGTASDLTLRTNVSVTGTTNSDGSITAQNIQIRPAGK